MDGCLSALWRGGDTGGVGEWGGGVDGPGSGERPERRRDGGDGVGGAVALAVETRSRGAYAADLAQRTVRGGPPAGYDRTWGGPVDGTRSGRDGDQDKEPDRRGGVAREVLARFAPERAGLPAVGSDVAVGDVAERSADRPWLAVVREAPREVAAVFAALDGGGGHGHIRHEGWVSEEGNYLRVCHLADPAQRDVAKRDRGIDGLKPGDVPHVCRSTATRITDPTAFAVAFARGVEHPKVRAALEAEFKEKQLPPIPRVTVPIAELLGSEGHRYCTGWKLEPINGSMKAARQNRDAWVAAVSDSVAPNVPEPNARPVRTFDGGNIVFAFGPNRERNGYEVVTMYPQPADGG